MSEVKVMHLSYLLREDEDPKVGDKVKTLCGLKRKLKKPNKKPVCIECFRIFSADAARTGYALEITLTTIEGMVEGLNIGRKTYSNAIGDNHIITGELVDLKP
jgi:hypothetical protein